MSEDVEIDYAAIKKHHWDFKHDDPKDITATRYHHMVCPWCGHINENSWELDFGSSDYVDTTCPHCGKAIHIYLDIEVTYETSKREEKLCQHR